MAVGQFPTINLNGLGVFLDGHSVLVENKGGLANEVHEKLIAALAARNMPDVTVRRLSGYVGMRTPNRPYTVTTTHPGITTTVYVGNHGQDLYASWRTYIRPVPNLILLVVLLVIAGVLGMCNGIFVFASAMPATEGLFAMIQPGQVFLASGICFIGVVFTVLLLELIVIGVAGHYIRNDPLAFFTVQPNIFDAEDIVAMSISVDNAMMSALESAGISRDLLRQKEGFKSGRGEVV